MILDDGQLLFLPSSAAACGQITQIASYSLKIFMQILKFLYKDHFFQTQIFLSWFM